MNENKPPETKDQDDEFEARVVGIVLKAIKNRGRIYREILTELECDLGNKGLNLWTTGCKPVPPGQG